MKIIREEAFGGIVFDTDTLRYRIVDSITDQVADRVVPLDRVPPRSDILSAPVRVYFEITRRCNLKCTHCFVSASPDGWYGLQTDELFALLDELHRFRVLDIRFTGGEPTAREDWYDILDYAKQLGFAVSLNTNAVYRDVEQTVERFRKLDLNQITVSIDGLEDAHNATRGSGSFRKTLHALGQMSADGLRLRINTVITRRNVKDVPKLVELAAQYVKEINLFYMRAIGRAVGDGDLSLSFEEHYQSALETLALRTRYPDLNIMHFERSFTERSILPDLGKRLGLLPAYPYGNTVLSVAADGSFWPHGYSPYQWQSLKLGGFPNDSITDIWYNSPKLDALRNWFRALMQRCEKCPVFQIKCAGINFETEIARLVGDIEENPYCISVDPVPPLVGF